MSKEQEKIIELTETVNLLVQDMADTREKLNELILNHNNFIQVVKDLAKLIESK